jgi:hypothetical protein
MHSKTNTIASEFNGCYRTDCSINQEEIEGTIRSRKAKDRQYNGQKGKGQTIQWSKRKRTDNTMVKKEKDRQYNGQKGKGQTRKQ